MFFNSYILSDDFNYLNEFIKSFSFNLSSNNNLIIYTAVIFVLASILLIVNIIFSVYDNTSDKSGSFECGLTSFSQTRVSYAITFIIIAILFLPFDLEISTILPYSLTLFNLKSFGLIILIIFISLLTVGFIVEFKTKSINIPKNHNNKPLYYNNNN
uniref:NADH-ubiquinone oxidoreductase chain 3 n=1 Tax=Groenewaldozyma salmanticensis TaxID=49332 RepID=E5L090_9ASCO|nr:NADH dehydrogenase subunit 3 [Groenewaldozyma salmanticensis]ADO51055.1 NADH dehydrogenase subunit 3 [Groenewaldozyma salmanticensis]